MSRLIQHLLRRSAWLRRLLGAARRLRYPGAAAYWQRRYALGGDSGAGSGGPVAAVKAGFLNDFVAKNAVQSVVELGCGDGRQLALARYPKYTGLDIAAAAVDLCSSRFADEASMRFALYDPYGFDPGPFRAELALSLEVIFHLTEPDLYRLYLQHLFELSARWVIVFASNAPDATGGIYPHYRPRVWLPDVPPGWVLKEEGPEVMGSRFFVFESIIN